MPTDLVGKGRTDLGDITPHNIKLLRNTIRSCSTLLNTSVQCSQWAELWSFYLLFYNINPLSNSSNTLLTNLDILKDKNRKRADIYCQSERGDKVVKEELKKSFKV